MLPLKLRAFIDSRGGYADALRFLIAGGANTLLTLGVYQLLLFVVSPDIAYGLCWVVGMVFLLVVYPSKVFVGSGTNGRKILATVSLYLLVFIISFFTLRTLVAAGLHERLAIFAVLVVSTAANFVLMRLVYRRLQ